MAEWFQVYSDNAALLEARRGVSRVVAGYTAASVALLVVAVGVGVAQPGDAALAALAGGGALTGCAALTVRRLVRHQQRVWRLDLSVHRAVGHEASGRHLSLLWTALDRVDVGSRGLTLVGHDLDGHRLCIEVAASMPDFAALSHRAVEYAEAFRRPVCVDGQPWEALDLAALYPSIRADSASRV